MPSSRLTLGLQPNSRLAALMSNQCAVVSWLTRKRVKGGSQDNRQARHTPSQASAAAKARALGTRRFTGPRPAAASIRLTISQSGRGSPEERK